MNQYTIFLLAITHIIPDIYLTSDGRIKMQIQVIISQGEVTDQAWQQELLTCVCPNHNHGGCQVWNENQKKNGKEKQN